MTYNNLNILIFNIFIEFIIVVVIIFVINASVFHFHLFNLTHLQMICKKHNHHKEYYLMWSVF